MLPPETIHAAVDAAVETGIASKARRRALMYGVEPALVTSIPEDPSPRIQTLYDLIELSRSRPALCRWLRNALFVVPPGVDGRAVFEQLLEQVERPP